MDDMARMQGTSAEVARGVHPEVAALGNVLTEMFNRLGVSQAAYARRVHLDKSVVSRYFSGKRLATQEFIDRLIQEVGEAAGAPVQEHVKEFMRRRRLSALQAIDPAEYELESLRGDLALSRRECERALRQVDGLHLLLEKKEQEVRNLSSDITRLQLDWAYERRSTGQEIVGSHGGEQKFESTAQSLMQEIEELKHQLGSARQLHEEAESRCEALKMSVLSLEEELAIQQSGSAAREVLIGDFIDQISVLLDEQQDVEASKDLSEASWSRSVEEVSKLLNWLQMRDLSLSTRFISDVTRFRSFEEVLSFGAFVARSNPSLVARFIEEFSPRVNHQNISKVCAEWRNVGVSDPWGDTGETSLADYALARAIFSGTPDREAVIRLLESVDSKSRFSTTLLTLDRISTPAAVRGGNWPVIPMSLIHMGWDDLAAGLIARYCQYSTHEEYWLSEGLRRMDEESTLRLLNFSASVKNRFVNKGIATRPVEPVCLPLGDRLMREAVSSQNFSLVEKFIQSVSEHGSMDVLRTAETGEMLWERYLGR
ncbi:helix-turn-helix domain-containing protein [Streptomyces virginiae]|uniref:helix-turn-helix domain-containing protein n=1 Tax=Streptomyces virginiae TaxID=1961 RepID=UPI00339F5F1F